MDTVFTSLIIASYVGLIVLAEMYFGLFERTPHDDLPQEDEQIPS